MFGQLGREEGKSVTALVTTMAEIILNEALIYDSQERTTSLY